MLKGFSFGIFALVACTQSAYAAACFEEAGRRYNIDPALLRAISKTESAGNPRAINRNANGSYDIGHMQINSTWLPTLKKFGISELSLYDPCVSTHVGAWILAGNISKLGYNWTAVGAYNAKSPDKRVLYAHKVSKNLAQEKRL